MSAADGDSDASLIPYKVGYAKPPEDSRFKKGLSGNPKGRPRKAKNKKPPWDPVKCPTDNLILEEAYGPVTIREGDKSIERMTDSQGFYIYFAEKHRKARDPERKSFWCEEWHDEQRLFDLLKDSLPKKHKRKLVNRSYAPDASRKGKTLEEFRRNGEMRDEFVG